MKTLMNFLGKVAQLVIVFMLVFAAPAIMISVLWLDMSIYMECMHSPNYCAVMFIMACIGVAGYVSWIAEKKHMAAR
jgi:hypothetical protein